MSRARRKVKGEEGIGRPLANATTKSEEASMLPWPPLPVARVSLFVDGSSILMNGSVGSMMIRNSKGRIIFATYHYLFSSTDALESKIHAIKESMALALQY